MPRYIDADIAQAIADEELFVDEAGVVQFVLSHTPSADVAPVVPDLRKTVGLLHDEYEKAKRNPIVHDPLAFAVYQVWKAVDGRRKNGR